MSASNAARGPNHGRPGNTPVSLRILPGDASTPDGHLDQLFGPFLSDAIETAPMPDFGVSGEPYPTLATLVLDPDAHQLLTRLTGSFDRIIAIAIDHILEDRDYLVRLGFPDVAIEPLRREPTGTRPLLGRFDFLMDETGVWQLIEYNADTPSGLRETITVEPLVWRHLPRTLRRARPAGTPLGASLAQATLGRLSRPLVANREIRTLGIFTDASHTEDFAQTEALAKLIREPLSGAGIEVVVGDVDNLHLVQGRLHFQTGPVDAVYRYFPFETLLGHPAWTMLFTAVATGQVRLLNGLRGLLAQNKGVLAWIWSHQDDDAVFDPGDRATIRRHLPATGWVDAIPPRDMRDGLILKQVFGREGEEVRNGSDLDDDAWRRCVAWGSYVSQRRVPTVPSRAIVATSRGHREVEVWPCVGSFAVEGHWAGYYTRIGAEITQHDAQWCATGVAGQPAVQDDMNV
ncbi:MAG: hypothetical protein EXR45_06150 [Chloroflexi bacterium]|nr:hypothetical protein [Chloroflexota bacterium]